VSRFSSKFFKLTYYVSVSETISCSKVNLEAEIIVYRHLLGIDESANQTVIHSPTHHIDRSEVIGKYMVNNKKKGSISISTYEIK
jgi:hypothetical protein